MSYFYGNNFTWFDKEVKGVAFYFVNFQKYPYRVRQFFIIFFKLWYKKGGNIWIDR
jgi:hypothetical protein